MLYDLSWILKTEYKTHQHVLTPLIITLWFYEVSKKKVISL